MDWTDEQSSLPPSQRRKRPVPSPTPLPDLGQPESISAQPSIWSDMWGEVKRSFGPALESTMGFFTPAGIETPLQKIGGEIAPPFFSALKRFAESKLPRVFSGEQGKNTLRKGSTTDEWKRSGLEEKLEAGKKYTKEEVLGHIDQATPELRDVMLGEQEKPLSYTGYLDYVRGERKLDISSQPAFNAVHKDWMENGPISRDYQEYVGWEPSPKPKFSTYQEPGGTNYKEMFVTAPNSQTRSYSGVYTLKEAESLPEGGKAYPMSWRDGHPDYSDIENPIVRLRFNDRVDAEGKKVLFLEEMQPPNPENQTKMPPELLKRWREIGMKRAIKYAVDNGYDRVAWTTGEMQASRYDLSKHISSLKWEYFPSSGNFEITGKDLQGKPIINTSATEDTLPSVVGKEMAQKIMGSEQMGHAKSVKGIRAAYDEYRGIDLKVGGEGLKRVYDQDLPNVAKKLGAKVGYTSIPRSSGPYFVDNGGLNVGDYKQFDSYSEAASYADQTHGVVLDKTLGDAKFVGDVPSIDLSPLRPTASQGFPWASIFPPMSAYLASKAAEAILPPSERKKKP